MFAFVVLLGTVFPLIVEALQDRQIAVGAPFFDRLGDADRDRAAVPDGGRAGAAVAQGEQELLRDRLFWPAWCGVGALAGGGASLGADGWAPLVAFGLGGFAGGAALRQLVLATRRQGWRGLVGRANGGMVVHLGVIIVAVALAASNSYTRVGEFTLAPGEPSSSTGTRSSCSTSTSSSTPRSTGCAADVQHRRRQSYAPAITRFPTSASTIGTPSVRTGFTKDIYLTLESPAAGRATDARGQGLHQADDPVAVDRRRADGGRHGARRVPRPPPAPDRTRRRRPVPTPDERRGPGAAGV